MSGIGLCLGVPQRSPEWPGLPKAPQTHREQEWGEGIIGTAGKKSWKSSLIGAPRSDLRAPGFGEAHVLSRLKGEVLVYRVPKSS